MSHVEQFEQLFAKLDGLNWTISRLSNGKFDASGLIASVFTDRKALLCTAEERVELLKFVDEIATLISLSRMQGLLALPSKLEGLEAVKRGKIFTKLLVYVVDGFSPDELTEIAHNELIAVAAGTNTEDSPLRAAISVIGAACLYAGDVLALVNAKLSPLLGVEQAVSDEQFEKAAEAMRKFMERTQFAAK
ncbi:MAG: hypothetical protein LBN97_04765 [Oscillospiraceae bacterium]|jgi:hypothetical protein|nr:hypothetical protein [Oscillospiraceae bacterium]